MGYGNSLLILLNGTHAHYIFNKNGQEYNIFSKASNRTYL